MEPESPEYEFSLEEASIERHIDRIWDDQPTLNTKASLMTLIRAKHLRNSPPLSAVPLRLLQGAAMVMKAYPDPARLIRQRSDDLDEICQAYLNDLLGAVIALQEDMQARDAKTKAPVVDHMIVTCLMLRHLLDVQGLAVTPPEK